MLSVKDLEPPPNPSTLLTEKQLQEKADMVSRAPAEGPYTFSRHVEPDFLGPFSKKIPMPFSTPARSYWNGWEAKRMCSASQGLD
jgi:hypothetical protein